jgi:hypothetical protein
VHAPTDLSRIPAPINRPVELSLLSWRLINAFVVTWRAAVSLL